MNMGGHGLLCQDTCPSILLPDSCIQARKDSILGVKRSHEAEGHSAKALDSRGALWIVGGEYAGARGVPYRFRFTRLLQDCLLSCAPSPDPRHTKRQEQLRCAGKARRVRLLDASVRPRAESGRGNRPVLASSAHYNFL